jgi:hypothetical protein
MPTQVTNVGNQRWQTEKCWNGLGKLCSYLLLDASKPNPGRGLALFLFFSKEAQVRIITNTLEKPVPTNPLVKITCFKSVTINYQNLTKSECSI